jgi:arylsulfatase A-like enzyme
MNNPLTRRQFVKSNAAAALGMLAVPSVLTASKTRGGRSRPPNLLFVMADQWRRQAMGFAQQDPVLTPHFDRFAEDALVFNQACATRPICSPNRSCLLTGLYAQKHGHYMNGLEAPLDPQWPNFGGILKQAGYRTSYTGKLHIGGQAESRRGELPKAFRACWDDWTLAVGHNVFEQTHYIGRNTKPTIERRWAPDFETQQTIAFMQENRAHRFAAVLSWGPPHTSGGLGFENRWQPGKGADGKHKYGHGYAAPAQFEAPYLPGSKLPTRPNVRPVRVPGGEEHFDDASPGYYGACTALDASFGKLIEALKELNLYDDTLIVFTSDHGEMLGSHGRGQKGIYFEESIGVPLLMRLGDTTPARRVDELIATIDLAPTMLGLLGVETNVKFDGSDHSEYARGRKSATADAVFLSFDAGGPRATESMPQGMRRTWHTMRTRRYSYTLLDSVKHPHLPHQDRRVLYDLSTDPCQLQPIFGGRHRPIMDDLHARLLAHLDSVGDDFARTKFVWS